MKPSCDCFRNIIDQKKPKNTKWVDFCDEAEIRARICTDDYYSFTIPFYAPLNYCPICGKEWVYEETIV